MRERQRKFLRDFGIQEKPAVIHDNLFANKNSSLFIYYESEYSSKNIKFNFFFYFYFRMLSSFFLIYKMLKANSSNPRDFK